MKLVVGVLGIAMVGAIGCNHGGAMASADGGAPVDAGAPGGADGSTGADAGTDGMPPAGPQLVIEDGFSSITQYSFDDSSPGGSSPITLLVHNTAATATGPLSLTLTTTAGDGQFAIDDSSSSCHAGQALAAAAQCWVRLVFTAGTVGDTTGSLAITDGTVTQTLPLAGRVVAPTGIVASPSSLDFGVAVLDDPNNPPPVADVTLTNTSTAPIPLDTRYLPANVTITIDNCAFFVPLAPGASCTMRLQYQPFAPGPLGGSAMIATDTGQVTIPLHALIPYRVNVSLLGIPAAHISSRPAGIDCDVAPPSVGCSGLAFGPVTLSATSPDGASPASWELPAPVYNTAACGNTPSCTLFPTITAPPNTATVLARFVSGTTTTVHLTIAGTGQGYVHAEANYVPSIADDFTVDLGTCRVSCDLEIPVASADTSVTVVLTELTTEAFTGWTAGGVVATTESQYRFSPTSPPDALTAVFDRDPREQLTLFPDVPTSEITWAPDGDLVVAGRNVVSKLTPDGTVVWTTALRGDSPSARAFDLVVAATGEIDVVVDEPGFLTLHQLSATGQPRWSKVLLGAVIPEGLELSDDDDDRFSHYLVAAANGDIALRLAQFSGGISQVVVMHNDGTPAWTVDTPGDSCSGIAAAPDGSYEVTVQAGEFGEFNELLRYAADGTPLADFGVITAANWFGAIAVDAAGDVALSGTEPAFDANKHTIVLLNPDASVALALAFPIGRRDDTQGVNSGIVFDASGNLVTAREANPDDDIGSSGVLLQQWSPTGDSLWTVNKPTDPQTSAVLVGSGLAADAAHHVVISGSWSQLPWIEIFAMP